MVVPGRVFQAGVKFVSKAKRYLSVWSIQPFAQILNSLKVNLFVAKYSGLFFSTLVTKKISLTAENTKGRSITVPLTSCLTGLESAVWLLTIFVYICKTDQSKPVKQEVSGTVILPPSLFPAYSIDTKCQYRKTFFLRHWFLLKKPERLSLASLYSLGPMILNITDFQCIDSVVS